MASYYEIQASFCGVWTANPQHWSYGLITTNRWGSEAEAWAAVDGLALIGVDREGFRVVEVQGAA